MNKRLIKSAEAIYLEQFGGFMSEEAIELAGRIKTLDDLDLFDGKGILSAGEFDALETVLVANTPLRAMSCAVEERNWRNRQ